MGESLRTSGESVEYINLDTTLRTGRTTILDLYVYLKKSTYTALNNAPDTLKGQFTQIIQSPPIIML